jgi:hypothetical protein
MIDIDDDEEEGDRRKKDTIVLSSVYAERSKPIGNQIK